MAQALNSLIGLSKFLRPGYHVGPKMAYGVPVGDKENMGYAEAKRTYNLLITLERFQLFRNATMDPGVKSGYLGDNELYYRVTIWENLNVQP